MIIWVILLLEFLLLLHQPFLLLFEIIDSVLPHFLFLPETFFLIIKMVNRKLNFCIYFVFSSFFEFPGLFLQFQLLSVLNHLVLQKWVYPFLRILKIKNHFTLNLLFSLSIRLNPFSRDFVWMLNFFKLALFL